MDLPRILDDVYAAIRPTLGEGRIADYIPQLAGARTEAFGLAVHTVDGQRFSIGDAGTRFSVQSISKVFTLALAMRLGDESLWRRVGREPSGNPFNSLVQLEYERGIPRNPFINAGALVVTDTILSVLNDAKRSVLDFVRRLAGRDDIAYDLEVARSEQATGHRNRALAHFIRSFGNLQHPVEDLLDAYFHHCALAMNCEEVAASALFLANGGMQPGSAESVVSAPQARQINALMLTCGLYDAVGDFAFRVGLPAKSGVGGGIVAVVPGKLSLCVWSPPLDRSGNSLAGVRALERFAALTGLSVF